MPRSLDLAKQRRWLALVQRQAGSELSVPAFCRRHRLCELNFYRWRRVLRQRGLLADSLDESQASESVPVFIQVNPQPSALLPPALELVLPQGYVVRVRSGFDPHLLRQLLAALQEPAC